MKYDLRIWRQASPDRSGQIKSYEIDDVEADMSFLEMLDVLNQKLIAAGEEAIAFDHDCREGICGACSLVIDGIPHGVGRGTTTCQLTMRNFPDGSTIYIEPFRVQAFPIIKDLVVDRTAFDRIINAGGFISCNTGGAPDANAILVAKEDADEAMDAAACIGCGACAAACKNASAMLFVAAKVGHLHNLPQGRVEAKTRATEMVRAMDAEGFGSCANQRECEAVCPKEISTAFIAKLNRS